MNNLLNRIVLLSILLVFVLQVLGSTPSSLSSPDGKITIQIEFVKKVYYTVYFEKQRLTLPCPISLKLENGNVLGENPEVENINSISVRDKIYPHMGNKNGILDHYNEMTIDFKNDFSIIFRAYNEGIAYRIFTQKKESIRVIDEEVMYRFEGDPPGYFPISNSRERSLYNWQENYRYSAISEIGNNELSYLPVLIELEKPVKVAITEADVWNYPGLYLEKSTITAPKANRSALKGYFAKYPETYQWGSWKDACLMPEKWTDYIARLEGESYLPWRVMIIADNDRKLGFSELVYKLSSSSKIQDTKWIKPGKVAWDWYNDFKAVNVDFKSGPNTQTWKYYIDFAAENNIEYVILDEGWSYVYDMKMLNPDVDLKELSDYAGSKNVGLILWCAAHILTQDIDGNLDFIKQFESIKGIKVDFFQRNDQVANNMYVEIARAAAQRKLVLNFHGCYIPTGIRRAYPNILTWEAVNGLESNKWSHSVTPEHDVILAYTRLLAGPMDYTPGAMDNTPKDQHVISYSEPKSQGTLCHQLSMYIIYDSPLQMLADSPDSYRSAGSEIINYLSAVPVVWDETIVLDGEIPEYIIKARRSGDKWYIGGMANWNERVVEINFDFLEKGKKYIAKCLIDGINSDKFGSDYKYIEVRVDKYSKEKFKMFPGGGFAISIVPE